MERVLVVGAGPAGLVTAITLARLGVPTVVVERRTALSSLPRATGISLRTMELLRSWGLEPAVRAGEMDVGTVGFTTPSLAAPEGVVSTLGFPTREQAHSLSPTTVVAAPQDHLEPVLLAHLQTYDCVEIRFSTELIAVSDDGTATLRQDGRALRERFAYVIGADGAHSVVRTSAGVTMIGPDDLGGYVAVSFRAPLASVVGPRRYALYMLQRPGPPIVFLPTDRTDRWMFAIPGDPTLADLPTARLVDLIRSAAGVPDLPVEILRVGAFSFAAQIASSYRSGRLFLVGDAAHRMTPRGGTGMNTAIHDGFDLGWKLGWVLRGWAMPSLLDSYDIERRPVGARNVERSAMVGSTRDATDDYLDDLGGRLPHAWLPDGRSTLDLLGPGLTLLTGPRGLGWASAAAALECRVPLAVHGVDLPALGLGDAGAMLVRPDGVPLRVWSDASYDELASAVRTITHPAPAPALV